MLALVLLLTVACVPDPAATPEAFADAYTDAFCAFQAECTDGYAYEACVSDWGAATRNNFVQQPCIDAWESEREKAAACLDAMAEATCGATLPDCDVCYGL